jgi:hypothetical protein
MASPCQLGDRGIDHINRDNPRLRKQVDRCAATGRYVQAQRAPRQLEHGRSAWAARRHRGDWGYWGCGTGGAWRTGRTGRRLRLPACQCVYRSRSNWWSGCDRIRGVPGRKTSDQRQLLHVGHDLRRENSDGIVFVSDLRHDEQPRLAGDRRERRHCGRNTARIRDLRERLLSGVIRPAARRHAIGRAAGQESARESRLAAGPPLLTRRLGAAAAPAPEGGLISAAGFGLKGEEPSDPQAPLAARKAKRRLAVSQEPLGSRTSLHVEQGSNPVSRDFSSPMPRQADGPPSQSRVGDRG